MTLQRDIDELLRTRKPLAIAGKRTKAVSAFYCLRSLSDSGEPMMFLFHAAKRTMPRSHDRNKQKRRMRQAIRALEVFDSVHAQLADSSKQALILLRSSVKPSKDGSWETILADMNIIGHQLQKAIKHHA